MLWDTYGFPLDLTQVGRLLHRNALCNCSVMHSVFSSLTFSICQLMAEEKGLLVDVKGFNDAMEAARERSRNAQTKVSYLLECPFSGLKCLLNFGKLLRIVH